MSSFKQLKEKRDARQVNNEALVAKRVDENTLVLDEAATNGHTHSIDSTVKLEANRDVQIRQTIDKGKSLFWSPSDGRKLGRGTTILRLDPEVTVPTSQSLETLCHRCFSESKDGKSLQRCSGCKVVRYCGTACQKSDWPAHSKECKSLQNYHTKITKKGLNRSMPEEPGTTIRLIGRLIFERQRHGPSWWSKIEALESKRYMITPESPLFELPMMLARYLGGSEDAMKDYGFNNAGEILDLVSRVNLNSFATYTSDLTAVGISVSSIAAIINHSCHPNIAIVYPNGPGAKEPMHVVALRDVEPEEELTTFYIDVSDPTFIRQENLQKRYGFKCTCELCERRLSIGKKIKVDPREAIWCGRLQCSGWIASQNATPTGQCNRCKQGYCGSEAEVTEIVKEGVQVLHRVNKLVAMGEMQQALRISKVTVKKLTVVMPPSAYPLLAILRQLQMALIVTAASSITPRQGTEYYEEAIRFHMLSIAGMQSGNGKVFFQGHPGRAIAMATLATLLVREATTPDELKWSAGYSNQSEYLSKTPPIPPMGPNRDQAGISLMVHAIDELKIAYGIDENGGEPGRKLIDQVWEYKESEAMMQRAENLGGNLHVQCS